MRAPFRTDEPNHSCMQAEYGSAAACVDDSKANAHQTNSSPAFKNSVDDRAFSSTKAFCDLPDCDVSCWKANSGRCGRLCFCLCDPLRWDVTGSECLASSAGPIYVHGKHAGIHLHRTVPYMILLLFFSKRIVWVLLAEKGEEQKQFRSCFCAWGRQK